MRRTWLFLLILTVCIIALAALALIFNFVPEALQTPRVVRIEPADGASEILLTSPITITFSAPMQVQAQASVQLEPRVNGMFAWRDNQTLVFTPQATLPISTTLTVYIATNARSWILRPLAEPVRSAFTTLARPYVLNSSPALGAQFLYVPNRITITFNRALDAAGLAEHLTIAPPIQNMRAQWDAQTLILFGFFQPHTQYQIQIPASVTDAEYGIPLGHVLTWSFITGEQSPNFSILQLARTQTFPANSAFSEPVQFTNVSRLDLALYTITPSEYETSAAAPFETWYRFQPASSPLKTWSVATNTALDQYVQLQLAFDALDAGTYYLKITTPEGVSDAKLLLIQ